MASGSYKQVNVQCPFFMSDDGKHQIRCEGIVDRSNISLNYRLKADYMIQIDTFCCQYYKRCEIYQMLMQLKNTD